MKKNSKFLAILFLFCIFYSNRVIGQCDFVDQKGNHYVGECKINGTDFHQRRQRGNQNHDANPGKAGQDLSCAARPDGTAGRKRVIKNDEQIMECKRPDRKGAI